jgi:hypothetical protein
MKIYVLRICMCNDEEWNVVICSLNTNIHVYVHEDFHEIYLLNVKKHKAMLFADNTLCGLC